MDARRQNGASEGEQVDPSLNDTSLIKGKADRKGAKQANRKQGDDAERKRPSRAEIQRREQEKTAQTASYFATLDEIHDDMEYGDQDAVHTWITIAGTLVDDLREARELFPADRVRSELPGNQMLTLHSQSTIKSAASRFKGLEVDEDVMASRLEAEINSNQGRA
jgi:hypothetical protein